MAFGVDYSGSRPTSAQLKAAGVTFVGRYIGSKIRGDGTGRDIKWLDRAEAKRLHADGFDIFVFFETTAQRADGGAAAGLADAKTADLELAWLGMPKDTVVYFCVDWDTMVGPKIRAYFEAIADHWGGVDRVGGYGSYRVIEALFEGGLVRYGCQTYAWSGDDWSKKAQLQQYSNERKLAGKTVDYERSVAGEFGQWRASAPEQEDDMAERAGVLQSRNNVPNKRTELTLSMKNGTCDQLGIYGDPTYDNPAAGYPKQGPGQFRVIAHVKQRTGVVFKDPNKDSPTYNTEIISVGYEADGKGWCNKVVLVMPKDKKADAFKIYRLDHNDDQYGADISHT